MTSDIRAYLAQFRGETVAFVPNPGNAGDSVIAAATYHCLDAIGLRYEVPPQGVQDLTGRIVLYGGGGNLVGEGTFSARTVADLHAGAKHLTILPHTVKDVATLLGAFGSNVTVICRERVSYDHVRSLGGRHETLLMDDMAFGLDIERLMGPRDAFSAAGAVLHHAAATLLRDRPRASVAGLRRAIAPGATAKRLAALPEGATLHAFRRDGEATSIALPEDNVDLSTVFNYGVTPPAVAFHAARCIMRVLLRAGEVHTNRLHVAICSAIAGRPTRFHPNNYYKCRAVYDFSMRGRFPNVTWVE